MFNFNSGHLTFPGFYYLVHMFRAYHSFVALYVMCMCMYIEVITHVEIAHIYLYIYIFNLTCVYTCIYDVFLYSLLKDVRVYYLLVKVSHICFLYSYPALFLSSSLAFFLASSLKQTRAHSRIQVLVEQA